MIPMTLGVDFGDSRIVVAAADRGNYPILHFETPQGETADWFPSFVTIRGEERRYGWDAWARRGEADWNVFSPLQGASQEENASTDLPSGQHTLALQTVVCELAAQLKGDLLAHSNLPFHDSAQPLKAYLGVPSRTSEEWRGRTAQGFREGGFEVVGLLAESTAASLEYIHFHCSSIRSPDPGRIVVYGLGDSSFEVSMVDAATRRVLGTEQMETLGGDEFDRILANMALEEARIPLSDRVYLRRREWYRLREECRGRRQAVTPSRRKIVVDLDAAHAGWGEVAILVHEFYDRCRPTVEETLESLDHLLLNHLDRYSSLQVVYPIGSGSEFPLVPICLRERFGWRVRRSARPRYSVATGLALQADMSQRNQEARVL